MRFCDLGPLRVVVEDRSVALNGRLATVLETLLLYRGQRVALDLLVDAVWPEGATGRSANTLVTHVWRLRKLLEPDRGRGQAKVLINDREGYRLVAAPSQVDSARFEQTGLDVLDLLTTQQYGRALEASDRALELWRGDPFDTLLERPWAAGRIAGLQENRTLLRERRIDALLGVGRPELAIVELEPLVAEHPFRERLWWQRMLAQYRLGRADDALRSFRTVRRQLMDEIGLEPGPELIDLERRILNQEPTLLPSAPVTGALPIRSVELRLPHRRTLIGRDAELDSLRGLVRAGRLVSVVGAAGCGKTVLAVETARRAAEHFADGVTLVDLSAAEPGSDAATVVLAGLEISRATEVDAAAALLAYAAGRRELLVLDNCEQLLDSVADLVDRLVEECPQLGLLITSREPLGMATEQVFPLAPLSVPHRRGVEPVGADEPALELLVSRVRLVDEPTGEDLAYARRICRAVDGIPLAIELAAALSSTYTLAEVAEQVERDPGQLAAVGRGQARHHQTLAAAIDRSYLLLAEDERSLHRRLAVLPGPFGRDLAEAVIEPESRHLVAGQLAGLVHRSLLTRTRVQGRTRFAQLAPIRGHALHALRARGERERAEVLCDDWIIQMIRDKPRAGRPEEAGWHSTMSEDLPTLRGVLGRTVLNPGRADGEPGAALSRMLGFWFYADLVEEGARWTEALSSGTSETDLPGVLLRLSLAGLLGLQSRADRALDLVQRALAEIEPGPGGVLSLQHRARPLSDTEEIQLGELLLATATCFSTFRDPAAMRLSLEILESSSLLERDGDLAVIHDASRCLIDLVAGRDEDLLRRAEASYARADAQQNIWAGWLAASCGSSIALDRRDHQLGLFWSRRVIDGQSRLGTRVVLPQLETFGDFRALEGRAIEAVRIFAATHYRARRAGNVWPRNPATTHLLSRCRAALTDAQFTAAWAVGPTLDRDELLW